MTYARYVVDFDQVHECCEVLMKQLVPPFSISSQKVKVKITGILSETGYNHHS